MRQDYFLNNSDMFRPEYTVSQEHLGLSAQRPIEVQHLREAGRAIPAHDHEFYELVLVRAGTATHRTEGGPRRLSARDFLILAPGQIHALEDVRGLEVDNVYYLSEWALRDPWLYDEAPRLCMLFLGAHLFPERLSSSPVHVALDALVAAQIAGELELLQTSPAKGVLNSVLARGALMKCLSWIDTESASQVSIDYQFLRHPLVRHVFDRIERALSEGQPCDVAAWARALGCSADHLSRVFRQKTGERPSAFFQRRRLWHATHALIYSSESMSQIAHRLGFSDGAHFSRHFRQTHGMAPAVYRRRFSGS